MLCQKHSYKNYQNLIIGFKVTVKNVGEVFWRHVHKMCVFKTTQLQNARETNEKNVLLYKLCSKQYLTVSSTCTYP